MIAITVKENVNPELLLLDPRLEHPSNSENAGAITSRKLQNKFAGTYRSYRLKWLSRTRTNKLQVYGPGLTCYCCR